MIPDFTSIPPTFRKGVGSIRERGVGVPTGEFPPSEVIWVISYACPRCPISWLALTPHNLVRAHPHNPRSTFSQSSILDPKSKRLEPPSGFYRGTVMALTGIGWVGACKSLSPMYADLSESLSTPPLRAPSHPSDACLHSC